MDNLTWFVNDPGRDGSRRRPRAPQPVLDRGAARRWRVPHRHGGGLGPHRRWNHLLGVVVYDFVRGLSHEPVVGQVLELLSGLLLVFNFTELVSTIRVVIARRTVSSRS